MNGSSTGGVAGTRREVNPFRVLAGPSTAAEFNTARLRPEAVACWRVDDIRFDFDSSVVLPEATAELKLLAKLIVAHTEKDAQGKLKRPPPLTIFGHADPVGNDDYNKRLSGRRAAAIYGLLTRRDEVWEDLFSDTGKFANPILGDKWGVRSVQIMLNALAGPVGIDGKNGPETQAAVRAFQRANGLNPDGNAGPATRKKVFLAYMEQVCTLDDGSSLQLDKVQNFLAQNDDLGGKGDFQGCGEFNPVLIFSGERNADFEQDTDKTVRNLANAQNRRVMALLFRPGTRVLSEKWPCPRAKDGVGGCIKRFFSDGERRRSTRLPETDRKFKDTKDTFACRFYQRLTDASPCDHLVEFWVIRLLETGTTPIDQRPALVNQPFSVTGVGGGLAEFRGITDAKGVLRIPVGDNPAVMRLRVAGMELTILGGSLEAVKANDLAVFQRLFNLGFGTAELETADPAVLIEEMQRFQQLHGLPVEDEPTPKFRARLRELHGS